MKKLMLVVLPFVFLYCPVVAAKKYPRIPFSVHGKILDWDTKKPLQGVNVVIFLNDAVYADNNGWNGEHDYPNFPQTDEQGEFDAQTQLYRKTSRVHVKTVEMIALYSGYRTERFLFTHPQFLVSDDEMKGMHGFIKLPNIHFPIWNIHKR